MWSIWSTSAFAYNVTDQSALIHVPPYALLHNKNITVVCHACLQGAAEHIVNDVNGVKQVSMLQPQTVYICKDYANSILHEQL